MGFIELYGFLIFLGVVWAFIAGVQDMKTTFVANWLTYSLIIFGLAYRFFYGIINNQIEFFYFGVIGFGVFFILAHLFYYAKVFGGGDAKLLIGFGVVLPYESLTGIWKLSLEFFALFFIVGGIYSLVYGSFLAVKHWSKFRPEFLRSWKNWKNLFVISVILAIVFIVIGQITLIFLGLLLVLLSLTYPVVKALEKSMIVLKSPHKLLEGDWMHDNIVKLRGKVINRSIHGLSLKEISMLKKANKKVRIKEGIPFVPVFFLALFLEYAFNFFGFGLF